MIENDFDAASFEGIRCANSTNPDEWRIVFPRLLDYRGAWLAAAEFQDQRRCRLHGIRHQGRVDTSLEALARIRDDLVPPAGAVYVELAERIWNTAFPRARADMSSACLGQRER